MFDADDATLEDELELVVVDAVADFVDHLRRWKSDGGDLRRQHRVVQGQGSVVGLLANFYLKMEITQVAVGADLKKKPEQLHRDKKQKTGTTKKVLTRKVLTKKS